MSFDVATYGAVGDGVHDDQPHIQAAINAAQAVAGVVQLGYKHKLGARLHVTSNLSIKGSGLNNSWLLPTGDFEAIFYEPAGVSLTRGVNLLMDQNETITLEGFSIQYPSIVASEIFAIRLQPVACNLTQPLIRDVGIYNASNGILAYNAVGGVIDRSVIMNFYGVGIRLESPDSPDGGGMIISRNSIVNYQSWNQLTGVALGTGIYLRMAGGTKIIDNGFAALANGVYASIAGISSQLFVHTNSFDTTTNASIWLARATANVTFHTISIRGNTFASPTALYVATDTVWLKNLDFSQNILNGASGQNASQVYIDGIDGFTISHNRFVSNSVSPTAINVGVHSLNGYIGPNSKVGTYAINSYGTSGTMTVVSPT